MFIKWVGHEILVPHLHIPSAEPGFARSWTACALKLSLLTTAWKFSSPLLAKVRSDLFGKQTTRWSGWHPFTKTKPPACVLIQVEATRSPDQGELQSTSGQIQAVRKQPFAPEHGQMLNWDCRVPPTGHSRNGFSLEAVGSRCDHSSFFQPEERLPGCPSGEGWPLTGLPDKLAAEHTKSHPMSWLVFVVVSYWPMSEGSCPK